ncbi:MAG: ferritin-like domain-containing protein [Gemmatimonadaceae bacterium]
MKTLHDLFVDELKDIHSAERQLVQALPKMIRGANSEQLSQALSDHLEQTKEQISRLDEIFKTLEKSPKGKKCLGMEGLIAEGAEILGEDGDPDVLDAGIIGAAQRVEHYEIAAYGTAIAHAKAMGHEEIAERLRETLDEEEAADRLLTEIAEGGINRLAVTAFGEGESEEE